MQYKVMQCKYIKICNTNTKFLKRIQMYGKCNPSASEHKLFVKKKCNTSVRERKYFVNECNSFAIEPNLRKYFVKERNCCKRMQMFCKKNTNKYFYNRM